MSHCDQSRHQKTKQHQTSPKSPRTTVEFFLGETNVKNSLLNSQGKVKMNEEGRASGTSVQLEQKMNDLQFDNVTISMDDSNNQVHLQQSLNKSIQTNDVQLGTDSQQRITNSTGTQGKYSNRSISTSADVDHNANHLAQLQSIAIEQCVVKCANPM